MRYRPIDITRPGASLVLPRNRYHTSLYLCFISFSWRHYFCDYSLILFLLSWIFLLLPIYPEKQNKNFGAFIPIFFYLYESRTKYYSVFRKKKVRLLQLKEHNDIPFFSLLFFSQRSGWILFFLCLESQKLCWKKKYKNRGFFIDAWSRPIKLNSMFTARCVRHILNSRRSECRNELAEMWGKFRFRSATEMPQ